MAAAASEQAAAAAAGAAVPPDGAVVFPGDVIGTEPSAQKLRFGPGLLRHEGRLIATQCGVLRRAQTGRTHKLTLETSRKRYVPVVEDLVVGTVVEKHTENYRVDIGASEPARLSTLAFEGATKRNKPNIAVGSLVYARVEVASKDMEPQLTCCSPFLKKDWVTGQSLLGELQGGYVVACSTSLVRTLLDERCFVLSCLGKRVPFELAIGQNGRVWVRSVSPVHTVLVANALLNSEHMDAASVAGMVEQLLRAVEER